MKWADIDEPRQLELLKRDVAMEVALMQTNVKGVLDFAQGALRSITLVNGAAVIALLTFLGNGRLSDAAEKIMGNSLIWFAWGVGCGIGAAAVAYLAQLELTYGTPRKDAGEGRKSYCLRMCAIALGLCGIGAFIIGVWLASRAFV